MKRKITALTAAVCAAALIGAPAFAQGPVEQIADGAGDVIENIGEGIGDLADGIGSAAGDVLDGAGNAVEDVTGTDGEPDTISEDDDIVTKDGDLVEVTEDDDTADLVDPAEDDILDKGKIAEAELYKDNSDDGNPSTGGLPFMTAGLVAVTAAGVAYLTKKRNAENGQ